MTGRLFNGMDICPILFEDASIFSRKDHDF
ncbi:hypothetical protein DFR30_2311 [Thiogranum longum]|uniref:Uncharacterized protein n=1 Tax=Thiogranum longum TaxID=1537524 RepID=A0A4R1HHX6_9GAMM|nr:hypothetical protein DFR30_2311 [Thiogranum longum]